MRYKSEILLVELTCKGGESICLVSMHLQSILLARQVSQPGQRSALAGCYAHLILVIYLHVFHTNDMANKIYLGNYFW